MLVGSRICSGRSKNACVLDGAQTFEKGFQDTTRKKNINVVTGDESIGT